MIARKNSTSKPTSKWGKIWRLLKLAGLGAMVVEAGRRAHNAGATDKVAGAVRSGVQKVKGSSQDTEVASGQTVGDDGGKVTKTDTDVAIDHRNQGSPGTL
jgi:hypothetical protein